jgi:PAS domain S-box-containing protein
MLHAIKNWRIFLLIGAAPLIAAGLIGYGYFMGEQLYSVESPLLNTVGEIEFEASRVRTRVENVVTGVQKYADDQYFDHLEESIHYLASLVRSKKLPAVNISESGRIDIFSKLEKLNSILGTCRQILFKFNSQQPRYSQPDNLKAEVASAFFDFSKTLFEIKTTINSTVKESKIRFRLVQGILIGLSILLILVATITILRYERERLRQVEQLDKGRRELLSELVERQAAEKTLADNEQLLRTVFDYSPVAIIVTRLADSRIVDVNDVFVASSGYERTEVLGRTFQDIPIWGNPADREAVLQRLTVDRQVRDLEFQFRIKNGHARTFLLSANIVDINDEAHILASGRDVTDLKLAEARMMWLASFPMLNPFPIVELDLEGHVHYLNPTAEKLFPVLSQQGAGNAWFSDWESFTRSFRNGGTKTAVREVLCDGKWYHQALHWVEETRRIRIYGLDITARKQAEEALKLSHDALETWVNERTQQLLESNQRLKSEVEERLRTEQSLVKHQIQLRKLSSALVQTEERERRRISTAIHDGIGQTLAATKIKLGAIRSSLPPSEVIGQLDGVRDLISSAILETRTLTFELSLPVLYEIGLKPALEWMAEQFKRKYGLWIAIDSDGGDGDLAVPDRVFLFQAIREFCFNVVKHAQATRAMVSVRREEDAGIIRCEVVDDGVGFDVAKHAQVLGTEMGFGLFSIREQLRQCGGALTLDTGPENGTRVVLRLPLNIITTLHGGAVDEDPGAAGG